MKKRTPKILAVIPSEFIRNNRRGAQRDTWIWEAQQDLIARFVVQGTYVEKEEALNNDVRAATKAVFDGKHISIGLVETIEFMENIHPEWILICDDLTYVWIDRFLPDLQHPTINFLGYESPKGSFYFIRRSVLKNIDSQLKKKNIIQAIKAEKIPLTRLKNITDEEHYPKDNNKLRAMVGERPDKIIRVHERRNKPHIAIITVAIGKYDRFWPGWYEAVQEYFLPQCTRHYYVFTDADPKDMFYLDCDYTTVIHEENLGWPAPTRDRFAMMLKLRKDLERNYDFVYFLQVTGRLTTKLLEEEAIPDAEHDWLWVTRNVDLPELLTYDPNKHSAAYIPKEIGKIYAQGGALGGRVKEFLQLCEACEMGLRHNRENGEWEFLNDESHLNHYILTKNPLQSWLRFWWPPTKEQAKKCKIFTLEKRRYGGFRALKEKK